MDSAMIPRGSTLNCYTDPNKFLDKYLLQTEDLEPENIVTQTFARVKTSKIG